MLRPASASGTEHDIRFRFQAMVTSVARQSGTALAFRPLNSERVLYAGQLHTRREILEHRQAFVKRC